MSEMGMMDSCAPPHKRRRLADNTEMDNILRRKKLVLVLDLDNTLIVSKSGRSMALDDLHLLNHSDLTMLRADNESIQRRSLFAWISTALTMSTKLRPSTQSFLKQANALFDMYIYTAAGCQYARQIAKLLDPDQEYFRNRIISNEDSSKPGQKGLDIVQHDKRFVVIIDDKEDVWPNDSENLIQIANYQYFSSSNSGPVNYESKMDEDNDDCVLDGILNVLTHAHRMFFHDPDLKFRDTRVVLREIKQQVLKGCKIVFGKLLLTGDEESKSVRTMAQEMGSVCCDGVDDSVTHVVSSSSKIRLARWARRNNKFLVTPLWVEASYYSWRRKNEDCFKIQAEVQSLKLPNGVKKESLMREVSQINKQLTEAKRERDEAQKENVELTDMVTELCSQVSFLIKRREATIFHHKQR